MSKPANSFVVFLLVAGCRGDCEEDRHRFELALDGAGAAFEIRGRTSDPQESVFASYFATVTNHSTEPCLVSFLSADSRPRPEDRPQGVVQYETVVPGVRDGRTFQTLVDAEQGSRYRGVDPWGIELRSSSDDYTVGISLRIATCPEADLEVELVILTEVCWSLADERGFVDVTQLW